MGKNRDGRVTRQVRCLHPLAGLGLLPPRSAPDQAAPTPGCGWAQGADPETAADSPTLTEVTDKAENHLCVRKPCGLGQC